MEERKEKRREGSGARQVKRQNVYKAGGDGGLYATSRTLIWVVMVV